MPASAIETIQCIRCRQHFSVNLAKLGKPESVLYKDGTGARIRTETFRVICPNCGSPNMLDVDYEEQRNAR